MILDEEYAQSVLQLDILELELWHGRALGLRIGRNTRDGQHENGKNAQPSFTAFHNRVLSQSCRRLSSLRQTLAMACLMSNGQLKLRFRVLTKDGPQSIAHLAESAISSCALDEQGHGVDVGLH